MGIFLVIFLLLPTCFCCSARASSKDRVKIVEDYVLSAKFDTKPNLPQLKIDHNKASIENSKVLPNENFRLPLRKNGDNSVAVTPYQKYDDWLEDSEDYPHVLDDRDHVVHYHVPPPPSPPLPRPPPPPPPPRPAGHLPVAVPFPSFFAVGFIAFLILLNSLQTTLLLTVKNKLGPLKPLGRRKRFAHAIFIYQ